jgi:hypothetical protein
LASLSGLVRASGFEILETIENELLFYLVERFYFEGFKTRGKIMGPVIAAAFNIPTSQLPFGWYEACDRFLRRRGFTPRQIAMTLHPRMVSHSSGMSP